MNTNDDDDDISENPYKTTQCQAEGGRLMAESCDINGALEEQLRALALHRATVELGSWGGLNASFFLENSYHE